MSVVIDGTTGISGADGSAATPALRGEDTNTGVFFPAADTIAFAEGGAEVARFNSSGNFGVGTTSPSSIIHVSAAEPNIRLQATSATYTLGAAASGGRFYLFDITNSAERLAVSSTGNLQFNSGYGSVATAFGCRAWVNFNGTGTVAIRASGNVSSITDNGTGDYTVNFTTAMPDANYCAVGSSTLNSATNTKGVWSAQDYQTTSLRIVCSNAVSGYVVSTSNADHPFVNVAVFR
jgi:hypothetical protein